MWDNCCHFKIFREHSPFIFRVSVYWNAFLWWLLLPDHICRTARIELPCILECVVNRVMNKIVWALWNLLCAWRTSTYLTMQPRGDGMYAAFRMNLVYERTHLIYFQSIKYTTLCTDVLWHYEHHDRQQLSHLACDELVTTRWQYIYVGQFHRLTISSIWSVSISTTYFIDKHSGGVSEYDDCSISNAPGILGAGGRCWNYCMFNLIILH